jgi:hypothetical protein
MHVEVVVARKLTKRVICTKFKVVDGALLFFGDKKMTQLIEGFKVWRRFNVIEEKDEKSINLVPVNLNKKNKKGV